jgi:Flp pilus assembly protein protease CpaA
MFAASAIVSLVFSGWAAKQDLKTHEIENWLTYFVIGIGVLWSLVVNPPNLLAGVIVFVICLALYKTKAIGGGDVKLFTGLTLISPIYDGLLFFFVIFAISYSIIAIWAILNNTKSTQKFGLAIFIAVILANTAFFVLGY